MHLILLFFAISTTTTFADELRTLTNRGTSALRRGNVEQALEHFSAAVANNPASNEARFNKALALSYMGNIEEVEAILSELNFENSEQNIQTLNLRAKISEAVGDLLAQNEAQPDFAKARTAYQNARAFYSQALDLNPKRQNHRNYIKARIENLSNKIRDLPENEQDENQDGDGENNQDKNDEQNENDQNQDGDNQNEQNQNEDKNNDDEQNEEDRNRQNEEEREREREQQQREMEERIEDATRMIELFADDASELKKPPTQVAQPAPGGKEW
jgi:Ca-activated chloride channel family protein